MAHPTRGQEQAPLLLLLFVVVGVGVAGLSFPSGADEPCANGSAREKVPDPSHVARPPLSPGVHACQHLTIYMYASFAIPHCHGTRARLVETLSV